MVHFKGIVLHVWKQAGSLLSCQELDKNIDITLMVKSLWSKPELEHTYTPDALYATEFNYIGLFFF